MSTRESQALAQLHAAFDRLLEAETALRAVRESGHAQPTVRRASDLIAQTRELVSGLIAPPLPRAAAR